MAFSNVITSPSQCSEGPRGALKSCGIILDFLGQEDEEEVMDGEPGERDWSGSD